MRKIIDILFYFFYLYLTVFETNSAKKLNDFWLALFAYFGVCVLTMVNAIAILFLLEDVGFGKNNYLSLSIFLLVYIFNAFMVFHKKHYKSVIEKYKDADKKTLKKMVLYLLLYFVFSIAALYIA